MRARQVLVSDAVVELISIATEMVSRRYGLTVEQLLSRGRHPSICRPRQIAVAICYELELGSQNVLAPRFNFLDHCTVRHAYISVMNQVATDPVFKREFDETLALVRARVVEFRSRLRRLAKEAGLPVV